MSASTAQIVLKSKTLRWSSPQEFNDPFDVARELAFGISPSELKKAVVHRFIKLIENPPDNTEVLKPKLRLIVETLKKAASQEIKTKIIEEAKKELERTPPDESSLEKLREHWRSLIPQFRILGFCESHEVVSMWYHYADKYRGAVIEFNCIDEFDSALLLARPVDYPEERPDIFTPNGWSKLLTMPEKQAIMSLFEMCAYTKTPAWGYEREWRVVSFNRPNEAGTTSDYKLNPREFNRVFLGPLMDAKDKGEIVSIAKNSMAHIRVYETEIGMDRRFNFRDIKS